MKLQIHLPSKSQAPTLDAQDEILIHWNSIAEFLSISTQPGFQLFKNLSLPIPHTEKEKPVYSFPWKTP